MKNGFFTNNYKITFESYNYPGFFFFNIITVKQQLPLIQYYSFNQIMTLIINCK